MSHNEVAQFPLTPYQEGFNYAFGHPEVVTLALEDEIIRAGSAIVGVITAGEVYIDDLHPGGMHDSLTARPDFINGMVAGAFSRQEGVEPDMEREA